MHAHSHMVFVKVCKDNVAEFSGTSNKLTIGFRVNNVAEFSGTRKKFNHWISGEVICFARIVSAGGNVQLQILFGLGSAFAFPACSVQVLQQNPGGGESIRTVSNSSFQGVN